jgi:hypothetical protein
MGTVPIIAFSEVKIEIVYFLGKGWLHTRVLHQELVKKGSTTLFRSDNDKVWQRSYWSGSHSPRAPSSSMGLLDAPLHNSRFLSQVRTYYKPKEDSGHRREAGPLPNLRNSLPHYQGTGSERPARRGECGAVWTGSVRSWQRDRVRLEPHGRDNSPACAYPAQSRALSGRQFEWARRHSMLGARNRFDIT